jgi:hypothetical protein
MNTTYQTLSKEALEILLKKETRNFSISLDNNVPYYLLIAMRNDIRDIETELHKRIAEIARIRAN